MKYFVITIITYLLVSCITLKAQNRPILAPTPPMGWNSWNKFGCNVSETLIKEMADAMVSSGMKEAGFEYIVIDDCWQVGRDSVGNIIPDPKRFPSGMKALGDYIHSKGLKFGIYSCAGSMTCQERPGSRGYQFQDARTYASWGVDYLKYDWCYNEGQKAESAYKTMSDALKATGRPIVFSICEWGESKPWKWGEGIGNLWRTTADIRDFWDCELNWGGLGCINILDKQVGLEKYAGPGHWNDPDMLEIGNGGMTNEEYKTHFSLWCMLAAPLMAGNDLRSMKPEINEILTNKDVIYINQDTLGIQGFRFLDFGEFEVWVKPMSNNEIAFCFLNRANQDLTQNFNWKKETVYASLGSWSFKKQIFKVYDVWDHNFVGTTDDILKLKLTAHSAKVFHLKVIDSPKLNKK